MAMTRRDFLKLVGLGSAGVASIAALTACGKDGEEATESYTLWLANNDTFTTTDDFNNFTLTNKYLCHLWGDTLVEMNYETSTYDNALATKLEWSDDALQCKFEIRQGVKFSNGNEMKASDVAFSYNRIINEADILANTMSWSGKLAGAEATGDYEGVINFLKPMPNFGAEACWLPILCEAAYTDRDEFWKAPIGSGPYKWVETDFANNTCKLQLWNKDWWGYEEYGKEAGNVEFIGFKNIDEDTTRISSVRTGEIGIAMNVPYDDIDTLKNDGVEVIVGPSAQHVFLCLNCHDTTPFNDMKVRQALEQCIDRETLMETIIGMGTLSTFPVPSYCAGGKEGTGYVYDLEAAKKLLAESSYDGSEIVFDIASGIVAHGVEIAQAIQEMMQNAGFKVSLNQMENAAYNEARFGGNYTMQLCSFSMTTGETFKIMDEIVGPTDFFQTGINNTAAYEKFEEAMVTMDDEKRHALQQEGYQLVWDNHGPMVYLYDCETAIGVVSGLEGLVMNYDSIMELRWLTKA